MTGPDGSENTVTAKNVLLAPGGYPDFPPGDGVRENSISSDGFFDLEELPEKSVVVGAGYIAVELAGVLNALGSDVTLVLRRDIALREVRRERRNRLSLATAPLRRSELTRPLTV